MAEGDGCSERLSLHSAGGASSENSRVAIMWAQVLRRACTSCLVSGL